jgi:hypothetical protein
LEPTQRATRGETPISVISDPRVVEASGMAVSTRVPDLAYWVNDGGDLPVIFSVRISTGEVSGATTLVGVNVTDIEALTIGPGGKLWVGDTGDNAHARGEVASRDEVALLALPQPGPGASRSVEPAVHRVQYPGRPVDAEGLAFDKDSHRLLIFTKEDDGGRIYVLPVSELNGSATAVTVAEPLRDTRIPGHLTDATILPNGRAAVLRT